MLPPPAQLTGVDAWPAWREGQEEAVIAIVNWLEAPEPVMALTAPAGAGKTLLAAAAAALARHIGQRAAILTPRKMLQAQMETDLSAVASNLYGRIEYPCLNEQYRGKSGQASDAACAGARSTCWSDPPADPRTGKKAKGRQERIEPKQCEVYKDGECPYYNALDNARAAPTVIANYGVWQAWQGKDDSPFDGIGLVVADEAHLLQNEMTTGQAIQIHTDGLAIVSDYPTPYEVAAQTQDHKQRQADIKASAHDIDTWREWAGNIIDLRLIPEEMGTQGQEIAVRELNDACASIRKLSSAGAIARPTAGAVNEGGFDWGRRNDRFVGVAFEILPIAPQLAQLVADPDDPDGAMIKTLCLSATVHPTMLANIGVSRAQHVQHEMPPTWDPDRSPVSQAPDAVPMTANDLKRPNAVQETHDAWAATIGPRRIDAMLFLSNSHRFVHDAIWGVAHHLPEHWQERVVYNTDSADLRPALKAHRDNPGILASASLGVGYDFKYRLARSIGIPKVPYPYLGDELVQARKSQLKGWYDWETIAAIMQMCGRGMRAEDDWCQTIIMDSGWQKFCHRTRNYQPAWFRQRLATYMPYEEFRALWAEEPAGYPVAPPEMDPGEHGLFVCDDCDQPFPGTDHEVAILESDDPYQPIRCESCILFG